MQHFDIPYPIVRKSSFCVPIMPISRYDKAYIGVRYGAFRPLKWAISHAEMAYIAMQQKVVKIQITDIQYIIKTSHISRICARRRVCPQIRAYFLGYIEKPRRKNQNPVIN